MKISRKLPRKIRIYLIVTEDNNYLNTSNCWNLRHRDSRVDIVNIISFIVEFGIQSNRIDIIDIKKN